MTYALRKVSWEPVITVKCHTPTFLETRTNRRVSEMDLDPDLANFGNDLPTKTKRQRHET